MGAAREVQTSTTGFRSQGAHDAGTKLEAGPTRVVPSDNPLAGKRLWVDPDSLAAIHARALAKTRPHDARLIDERIARQPQAVWLGVWVRDVSRFVRYVVDRAAARGELPVFVVYGIPGRDCEGGALGDREYRGWVREVAAAIGAREAVIVLEPDALGMLELENCLTPERQQNRLALLRDAIEVFRRNPTTAVYLDGGHSRWHPVNVHARLLALAGVRKAHGFALNTANFRSLDELLPFGRELSRLLDGAHFVIDTSRNGAGPHGVEWCNPPGRRLGKAPSTDTGEPLVDAYLWLKRPGESDGECHGGPRAGAFWERAALELAR